MRNFWRKLRASKRGFTLMECILASAVICAGTTLVMSMISMGFNFIRRSRSLDEMSAIAQEGALVNIYAEDFSASEGLIERNDNSGISVGYSDDLKVRVSFEIYYGSSGKTDVILPAEYNFVAVIVTDDRDNKLVYYMVSPQDGNIQKLYKDKQ